MNEIELLLEDIWNVQGKVYLDMDNHLIYTSEEEFIDDKYAWRIKEIDSKEYDSFEEFNEAVFNVMGLA